MYLSTSNARMLYVKPKKGEGGENVRIWKNPALFTLRPLVFTYKN